MNRASDLPFGIIGGGLAGSALALLLARAGRRVALFERDAFPRDKMCGEFLSPESSGLLADLGVSLEALGVRPARITHWRFSAPSGRVLEGELPAPAHGLSRRVLDEALFRAAARAGAEAHESTEVQKLIGTDRPASGLIQLTLKPAGSSSAVSLPSSAFSLLIAAYGRHSRLDHQLDRAPPPGDAPFAAFKLHHRFRHDAESRRHAAELAGHVEIHTFRDGYCGLCFVENDMVNVCALVHRRLLKDVDVRHASTAASQLSFLARVDNPLLKQRLSALESVSGRAVVTGQISFSSKPPALDRVLFLGDAAGMIAPLCGDGQAMALESAFLLFELLREFPDSPSAGDCANISRQWRAAWTRQFEPRFRLGRRLQPLLLRPAAANMALGVLGLFPSLSRHLVRRTRGTA